MVPQISVTPETKDKAVFPILSASLISSFVTSPMTLEAINTTLSTTLTTMCVVLAISANSETIFATSAVSISCPSYCDGEIKPNNLVNRLCEEGNYLSIAFKSKVLFAWGGRKAYAIRTKAKDAGFLSNGNLAVMPAFLAVAWTFTPTASSENLTFAGYKQVFLFKVHFSHS